VSSEVVGREDTVEWPSEDPDAAEVVTSSRDDEYSEGKDDEVDPTVDKAVSAM
jgi:hypothetical protein